MNCTKISPEIQRELEKVLARYPHVKDIVQAIGLQRGRALLVGGAVRDLLLDLPVKDLDIEVHGLSIEQLEKTLAQFGPVSLVGKAFGVFRVHGIDIDWSLPRADSPGRKPEVKIDPGMGIKEAFRRRDLTVNAMGIDLQTHELIDPFNGYQDLQDKLLRATDPDFFIEDPLRLFRVMQFIGRFEMRPDKQLNEICKKIDIRDVSVERIEMELKKLLLKSKRPSLGIRWLHKIGRLKEIMPELSATIGIKQSLQWHPEGDVFEHTMQALDAAAALDYDTDWQRLVLLYAALCHDLGKVTKTQQEGNDITSHGHAKESEHFTKKMLKRITRNKELINAVRKLARYHMQPVQFIEGGAKPSAYKRLANKLAPQTMLFMLGKLSLADKRGRNPNGPEPLTIDVPELDAFFEKAQKLRVLKSKEEPILLGRDLLDEVEPGPRLGQLLKYAYCIQLEEDIRDKKELKKRVLKKR